MRSLQERSIVYLIQSDYLCLSSMHNIFVKDVDLLKNFIYLKAISINYVERLDNVARQPDAVLSVMTRTICGIETKRRVPEERSGEISG